MEQEKEVYGDQAFELMVRARMEVLGITKAEAIRAVAKEHPKAHEAWFAGLKERQERGRGGAA